MNLAAMRAIAADLAHEQRAEVEPGVFLPRLAGGAPFWTLYIPSFVTAFGGEVGRPGSTEASAESGRLNVQDAPTLMTQWLLMNINMLGATEYRSEAAESPAGTSIRTTLQLCIGGDVVWQGSDEGEGTHEAGSRFSKRYWHLTSDFNNPLPFPRGRSLTLRAFAAAPIATTQFVTAVYGNNTVFGGAAPAAGSTISYQVEKLSGHRSL